MSVKVKFKIGEKKGITANYTVNNNNPIRTVFKIDAASASFYSLTGSPYDNANLKAALDLKADKSELESDMAAVDEAISNVQTVIENNYNTLDTKIDNVNSDLSGDISTLEQSVNNRIDATNQTVAELSTTVADNNTAINNRVDGIVNSFDGDISNLETAIQNEATTRANNDTLLQGDINTLRNDLTSEISNRTSADNTLQGNIDNIQNTIDNYGDIISYNASDFATAAQGLLADTALQPNDNISGLINDAGYITSAALTDYVTNTSLATTLADYVTNSALTTTLADYALTADIPTKTSDLTNDSNFATVSQIPTNNNQLTNGAGYITGINSSDVTNALGFTPADDSDVVKTTGDQNIAGNKTFTDRAISRNVWQVERDDFTKGDIPTSTKYFGLFGLNVLPQDSSSTDWQDKRLGIVEASVDTSGNTTLSFGVYRNKTNAAGGGNAFLFTLKKNANNTGYAALSVSPATSDNSTKVATTAFVKNNLSSYVPSSRTINGKALSSNISLTASDIGALPNTTNIEALTTTAQLDALNSGITSGDVTLIDTALQPNDNISGLINDAGYITSAALTDYVTNTSLATTLADYVTNSALTTTLADYALTADIPTKTSDLTNDSNFATVSQIPTNNNQLTNGAGYITNSALNGYAKTADLAAVATSGSYNDLTDKPTIPAAQVNADWNATSGLAQILNKPTIPTVGNGTVTINQGGTQKGTFTLNQNGNATINLDAGGTVDQTFDSTSQNAQSGVAIAGAGFLTSIPSSYLQNVATDTNALSILSNNSNGTATTLIGVDTVCSAIAQYGTAIGYHARLGATSSAIQLGYGTNSTANSFNVGFYNNSSTHYNWQLLDGTTGLIPDARLSSNIARTNDIPDISNLANTDLSNLSTTGQAVIDGQWVASYYRCVSGLSTDTDKTYSLSSYLPDDNYNYEVLFQLSGRTTTAQGSYVNYFLYTDAFSQSTLVAATRAVTAAYMSCGGNIILPVGTGRSVTLHVGTGTSGENITIEAKGYRRMGTNS